MERGYGRKEVKRRKNRWQRENEEKGIEEKHDTEENTVVRGNGKRGKRNKRGKNVGETNTECTEKEKELVGKEKKKERVRRKRREEKEKDKKEVLKKGLKASGERRRRARRH